MTPLRQTLAGVAFGVLASLPIALALQSCSALAQTVPSSVAARLARGSLNERELARAGQDMSPHVVLARVCAKEAMFRSPADCAPIAHVLLRVGRGDVVRGARQYSPRTFMPEHLGRRPWIAFLRGDGAQPRDWPRNLRWENHREGWLELVAEAERILSDPLKIPCEPHHWGAPSGSDHERAVAQGWERIACGQPTRNAFWRIPRRKR